MSNSNHIEDGAFGVPLPEKDRSFSVFLISQLYTGPGSAGNIVPNVDDLIIDYTSGTMERCTFVDYTNYTYQFEPFNPIPVSNSDATVGGCGPSNTDTFRIYVDTSKQPATLHVDGRFTVPGIDNSYCRIFRGTNHREDGDIISGKMENNKLVANTLDLVIASGSDNKTIKTVKPGVCTDSIEDGELVTMVVYTTGGSVAVIARFYIVVTNLVMALNAPSRQILDIKLVSPFISDSNDNLLLLPTNIPIDDIPLQAEIIYSNGSRKVNLDGTRAWLNGLRNSGAHDTAYISSNVGQTLPLSLHYNIPENEVYVGDNVVDNVINKGLEATTLEVDGSYSVKLFAVPRWLDEERGYRLDYYLYSLERGNIFNATPYVRPGINSAVFDPTLYGVKQRLTVNVQLNRVSPVFKPHIHPQSLHVTLLTQGNTPGDDFLIEYIPNQEGYGKDAIAEFDYDNINFWTIDVSGKAASKNEWLDKFYYTAYPLYDSRTESGPLEPTHFELVTKNDRKMLSVDQWHEKINIAYEIEDADTVLIQWVRRTSHDELQLGISPMIAKQKA